MAGVNASQFGPVQAQQFQTALQLWLVNMGFPYGTQTQVDQIVDTQCAA